MSAARPALRCLLARQGLTAASPWSTAAPASGSILLAAAVKRSPVCHAAAPTECRRGLHGSTPLAARRRPRFKSVKLKDQGLTTPEKLDNFVKKRFPGYTAEELQQLSQIYSPEQIEAIRAGEEAVDPRDLAVQGRLRRDPYRLGYVDDMSTLEPVIDKRVRTKPAPDTRARFMDPDEFAEDFYKWLESHVPADINLADVPPEEFSSVLEKYAPSNLDLLKYMTERSSLTDRGRGSNTALAPALMDKVPGVAGLYLHQADPEDQGLDDEGIYQDIKKHTGLKLTEIINTPFKFIVQRSVTNQTRLGKIPSWHIMCVVGNYNGRLGLGEAKSTELSVAKQKARLQAIKSMMPIRRYENRTIYGNVESKVSGTIVQMESRPPGFGLRASHRIFEICRLAGIRDLSARIPRSRCPMNTVKATIKCLTNQIDPEAIAIGRGRKLVDVRKVYYGGAVY